MSGMGGGRINEIDYEEKKLLRKIYNLEYRLSQLTEEKILEILKKYHEYKGYGYRVGIHEDNLSDVAKEIIALIKGSDAPDKD